jgi:hypothetical protein
MKPKMKQAFHMRFDIDIVQNSDEDDGSLNNDGDYDGTSDVAAADEIVEEELERDGSVDSFNSSSFKANF